MGSAAFDYGCNWQAGFVMDPTQKQRVGYLIQMEGLGMSEYLKPDIDVFTPYNSNVDPTYTEAKITAGEKDSDGNAASGLITVVGVIEHFSFQGGVGDPICISAYISAQNQTQLKGKMQTTLSTTIIKKLAFWLVNFDEENKAWFEEVYPKDPGVMAGQINAVNGTDIRLVVSDQPTKIKANIDVNVYNMYFEVVPAANKTYALHLASSGKTKAVRNWGLKVGTNAAAAMDAT